MTDTLWFLLLLSAVAGSAFYAGWRSAHSYLEAARAVSAVANAAAAQSNRFSSTLDKAQAEAASLRRTVESIGDESKMNSRAVEAKLADVESSIYTLFQGFERAGLARSPRPAPGPQRGEAGTE